MAGKGSRRTPGGAHCAGPSPADGEPDGPAPLRTGKARFCTILAFLGVRIVRFALAVGSKPVSQRNQFLDASQCGGLARLACTILISFDCFSHRLKRAAPWRSH